MLEELWHDRIVDVDAAKKAESEMQDKKQRVTEEKRANSVRREQIRERVVSIEGGVASLRDQLSELTEKMREAEEAKAAADEMRKKMGEHKLATDLARSKLAQADNSLERAQTECDALTKQLESVHSAAAQEKRRGAAVDAEGDVMATQLAMLQAEHDANAESTRELSTWYEGVTSIVKNLAGIASVVADGATVTYTFSKGTGGLDDCALEVRFNPNTCALAGATILPEGLLAIDDLEAHAVKANNFSFLIREVQARLDGVEGAADYRVPGVSSGAAQLSAPLPLHQPDDSQATSKSDSGCLGFPQPAMPQPSPAGSAISSALHAAPLSQSYLSNQPRSMTSVVATLPGADTAAPSTSSARQTSCDATPSGAAHQPAPGMHPTPVEAVVANLDSRMTMAAALAPSTVILNPGTPKATPKQTPKPASSAWVHTSGSALSQSRGVQEQEKVEVFRKSEILSRTPAPTVTRPIPVSGQGSEWSATGASASHAHLQRKIPGSALADTVARSDLQRTMAPQSDGKAAQTAMAMRVEDVEPSSMSTVGSARHESTRRSSRRSFSRAVAHPRSPCAIAARAGEAIDAKMIISEVVTDASSRADFIVYDALGTVRATVLHDGSVVDARGELLAYIEADGSVGDIDLQYIGEVTAANANSVGFCTNVDDSCIGEVDYGRGTIRDANGSTIASINRAGEVTAEPAPTCYDSRLSNSCLNSYRHPSCIIR